MTYFSNYDEEDAKQTPEGLPILNYSPRYIHWNGQTRRDILSREWRRIMDQKEPFSLRISRTTIRKNDLVKLVEQSFLRELDLSFCAIRDSDMEILREMTWLESLQLLQCRIHVDKLKILTELPNLKSLTLGSNFLTDRNISFLADFKSMTKLTISGSDRLTGNHWNFFSELPQLESVKFQYCNFLTPEAFNALEPLKSLHEFIIVNCNILCDQSLQFLDHFDSLRTFELYNSYGYEKSSITNQGIAPLKKHRHLERFALEDFHEITDEGLTAFENATNLQEINLSGTSTGDQNLRSLAALRNLKEFKSGNKVNDDALAIFTDKTELECLDLMGASLSENGLTALAGLKKLRVLELPWNLRNMNSARILSSVKTLESFHYNWCQNNENGNDELVAVASMTGLKTLKLAGTNNVTDEGLHYLRDLTHLEVLDLGYKNKITIEGFRFLSQLPALSNLKVLSVPLALRDDRMSEILARFPDLKILNDGNCPEITDNGLACWKDHQKVSCVDLAKCPKITARGIACLADLPELKSLNLSKNKQLDDHCAESLIKMKKLEYLGLRGTKISRNRIAMIRRELPDCQIDYFSEKEIIRLLSCFVFFAIVFSAFVFIHGMKKALLFPICIIVSICVFLLICCVVSFVMKRLSHNDGFYYLIIPLNIIARFRNNCSNLAVISG